MIRTNLSTRPFYNERGIHILVGLAALLVTALTVWNVFSVMTLSKQNTELSSRVNRDHDEAEQLTRMAEDIRRKIDQRELRHVADSAREANSLIDQRTFSWTAFFNRLESTMPPDVMLTSVRPSIKDGVTRVAITLMARRAEDIDEFIEKLEATGSFEDIVPSQQDRNDDDNLYRVALTTIYTGVEAAPEPAAPAAPPATPAAPAAPQAAPQKPGGGR